MPVPVPKGRSRRDVSTEVRLAVDELGLKFHPTHAIRLGPAIWYTEHFSVVCGPVEFIVGSPIHLSRFLIRAQPHPLCTLNHLFLFHLQNGGTDSSKAIGSEAACT